MVTGTSKSCVNCYTLHYCTPYQTIPISARQFLWSKAHIKRSLLLSPDVNWEWHGADCTVPKPHVSWLMYHDWLTSESMKFSLRYSVLTGPGGRPAAVRMYHERSIDKPVWTVALSVHSRLRLTINRVSSVKIKPTNLTFRWKCIVINSYNKTN